MCYKNQVLFIDNHLKSNISYDACLSRCSREGCRRNPTDWTYDSVPQPQLLYRGYTMHVLRNTDCGSAAHRNPNVEQIPIMYNFYHSDRDYIGKMLDEFGLINMPARHNANESGNGRCGVYPDFIGNPVVGRFLSPDIIVQNPNNTQCYNRYSYAINNPLKYADPSGWSFVPSVFWQPCYNGMRQHIVDKIYSKTWKPNEFNELSGLLEAIGGNSLNNAGEPLDFLGIYANNVKMAIGNMEKRPALTWSAVTTKYDDGSEFTNITYLYNNKVIALGTISKAIKDNKETLSFYLETADKANTFTGFVTYGIGVDAAFEAANFSYSAGERFGQTIISAKKLTEGGQAFFKSLGSRLEIAGKIGFWAGVFVGASSFALEPSVRKGIATSLDIGAAAALQWGGGYGAIAAGIYFGVKYGIEYTIGWDNLWNAYEKYPPHRDMITFPYY